MREEANSHYEKHAWNDVLATTRRTDCWATPRQRKLMRLDALMELRRFDQCISEGADVKEPFLRRRVETCRMLSQQK